MKQGKRIVSLILALVMICGLMVNASAAEAQEIKAQLSYDITVNYNGEAQTLTDAAGNIVYPLSYNGTTYLPVRAVSYVRGIAVDWDGATQTVLLSDGEAAAPEAIPAVDAPNGSIAPCSTAYVLYGYGGGGNGLEKPTVYHGPF